MEKLARELLGTGAGALECHQQSGFHLCLCPCHLRLIDGLRRAVDLIHDDTHQLGHIGRIGPGIEAEHSGVRIGRVERVDRVTQAALLTYFLKQARRHAAAEHAREHL